MEKQIVILIGAGQLGSRHLQALSMLDFAAEVFVVEPGEEQRETARQRWGEVAANAPEVSVSFHSDFSGVPGNALAAIVATNSLVRRRVVEELLERTSVTYLILEKFLFPRLADYDAVEQLLKVKDVRAFVNCPRRMYADYQALRRKLAGVPVQRVTVSGGSWGLGCNAVHFIDLIAFLSNCDEFTVQDELTAGTLESKRPGYVEFTGALSGRFACGTEFRLEASPSVTTPAFITIQSEAYNILISEASGQLFCAGAEERFRFREEPFRLEFQSALTGKAINQLAAEKICDLTPYGISADYHRVLLRLFLEHFNAANAASEDLCPIT